MRTKGIVLYVGAAAASVTILLAGCDDAPRANPSPSEHPQNSPAPKPTLPVLPVAAKARNLAGAQAFAGYYYDLVQYGDLTKDWAPLKALTLPSCTECGNFWKSDPPRKLDFEKLQNDDGFPHFEGNRAEIDLITPEVEERMTPGADWPPRWIDRLDLVYRDGSWKVESLEVEKN